MSDAIQQSYSEQTKAQRYYVKAIDKLRMRIYQGITPERVMEICESLAQRACDKSDKDGVKAAMVLFNVLGLLGIRVDATVTTISMDPEEAKRKVAAFFGLERHDLPQIMDEQPISVIPSEPDEDLGV